MDLPRSLYIHIPFCTRKCNYCDFFSVPATLQPVEQYISCLLKELDARAYDSKIETVFIGGGTPTVLGESDLECLLQGLGKRIELSSVLEFTVEANPGTVSKAKLELLRKCGVNRLSIGVQSFQPKLLRQLGRIHSVDEAKDIVNASKEVGFVNVSLDLMFGIPGQTMDLWIEDLDTAMDIGIEHLSAYGLTYEEGTQMHEELKAGRLVPVSFEAERDMALYTIRRARRSGLEHYEISNYAVPGRECRHNLVYWRNEGSLGIGASAVSYVDGTRSKNVSEVAAYMNLIAEGGGAIASTEKLDSEAHARETAVLAIRTRSGIDRSQFMEKTGFSIDGLFRTSVEEFVKRGVIRDDGERIALTDEGVLVADEVAIALV